MVLIRVPWAPNPTGKEIFKIWTTFTSLFSQESFHTNQHLLLFAGSVQRAVFPAERVSTPPRPVFLFLSWFRAGFEEILCPFCFGKKGYFSDRNGKVLQDVSTFCVCTGTPIVTICSVNFCRGDFALIGKRSARFVNLTWALSVDFRTFQLSSYNWSVCVADAVFQCCADGAE